MPVLEPSTLESGSEPNSQSIVESTSEPTSDDTHLPPIRDFTVPRDQDLHASLRLEIPEIQDSTDITTSPVIANPPRDWSCHECGFVTLTEETGRSHMFFRHYEHRLIREVREKEARTLERPEAWDKFIHDFWIPACTLLMISEEKYDCISLVGKSIKSNGGPRVLCTHLLEYF
ncbi:hypothetical protein NEOLI_002951 [Neolecta irregularis DAH-3]|uniref:Uncharacterized protein n=1 Tax=Neolecta irregularis (strain DAH-3) TaxID=1198029 RepID=A0A1U7LPX7_NEOID|nr:hypothetical protein NEOLI_002951 [Neolecta irregularis DAH-3]|eukprot:OLL24715.1 hypothetical protein NEOLI_002951 [Neolecta irregularis DAH-3]